VLWSSEDGGPSRQQLADGHFLAGNRSLQVTRRDVLAPTMVVWLGTRLYLLRHTGGDDAVLVVEEIDPVSLECRHTTPELPGGPAWPGGIAAHPSGVLHVVFGNHAYRLSPNLEILASRELPRIAPYNSFVTLADGTLITKDFTGSRPGHHVRAAERLKSELVALHPDTLDVIATLELPEPSIARLSARHQEIYVVGDTSFFRVTFEKGNFHFDDKNRVRYRLREEQGFGWDAVLCGNSAWFLDNGEGSENFDGSLRGHGVAIAPLHLNRVNLDTFELSAVEICGLPHGLISNPPVVDVQRGIAVGYDSGNGVIAAFDASSLDLLWRRDQDHASHLILFPESGELVSGDGTDVVILDIVTGRELARAVDATTLQSVLFPTPGRAHDFYITSFLSLSRIFTVANQ
jgi:hypothetical protein